MDIKSSLEVREATKVCLQRFAEGVMLGYRQRIFEAIDAKVRKIESKPFLTGFLTGEVKSYVNGLNAVKSIIQNLD